MTAARGSQGNSGCYSPSMTIRTSPAATTAPRRELLKVLARFAVTGPQRRGGCQAGAPGEWMGGRDFNSLFQVAAVQHVEAKQCPVGAGLWGSWPRRLDCCCGGARLMFLLAFPGRGSEGLVEAVARRAPDHGGLDRPVAEPHREPAPHLGRKRASQGACLVQPARAVKEHHCASRCRGAGGAVDECSGAVSVMAAACLAGWFVCRLGHWRASSKVLSARR
jgi:hypothetical protein